MDLGQAINPRVLPSCGSQLIVQDTSDLLIVFLASSMLPVTLAPHNSAGDKVHGRQDMRLKAHYDFVSYTFPHTRQPQPLCKG